MAEKPKQSGVIHFAVQRITPIVVNGNIERQITWSVACGFADVGFVAKDYQRTTCPACILAVRGS